MFLSEGELEKRGNDGRLLIFSLLQETFYIYKILSIKKGGLENELRKPLQCGN